MLRGRRSADADLILKVNGMKAIGSGLELDVRRVEIDGKTVPVSREHPWFVRFCHWLNAISFFVLIGSGLRIFIAFPSFGPKIPFSPSATIPSTLTIGGWLGGALQWHFTFMWILAGTGLAYVAYQLVTGNFRQVLFVPRDAKGVWPMVRYYFLFGEKPLVAEPYNPLQKLAYTAVMMLAASSVVTGLALYQPVQLRWLAFALGGFRLTRVWHFLSMCGFLVFIAGHLVMVLLHGWNNFFSMLSGWKKNPEYLE
jgi:Ni/Fe-hydrogenase b-type cytochrome subunit